jgi:hypothetical protein
MQTTITIRETLRIPHLRRNPIVGDKGLNLIKFFSRSEHGRHGHRMLAPGGRIGYSLGGVFLARHGSVSGASSQEDGDDR